HTLISTLSLHDALPICKIEGYYIPIFFNNFFLAAIFNVIFHQIAEFGVIISGVVKRFSIGRKILWRIFAQGIIDLGFLVRFDVRSEEHTSELQSRENLV